jgi:Do/DeqQ family serine protease
MPGSRGGAIKRVVSALVLLSGAALAPAALAGAPVPEAALPLHTLAPMLQRVTPGVVAVSVKGFVREENPLLKDPLFRHFFNLREGEPIERQMQAAGSGVVVDAARGYVLTNEHVVAHATRIDVTTKDNRHLRARLIGGDSATDIALLQIPAAGLVAVPMGDSDRLEVGDFVLAIGNAFGLGQSVTSGIVSALGRSGLGIEGYEDFIQTDASINPGNSGGALVNLGGQLVGINTAILARHGGNIGIGFAIPINMARRVMAQLVRYGKVERGRIGIAIEDLTPDLARRLGTRRIGGAVVASVLPGSPAARAGLEPRDVILAIDGRPVRNATDLRDRIGLVRVGAEVALTVDRRGEERTFDLRIAAIAPAGGR